MHVNGFRKRDLSHSTANYYLLFSIERVKGFVLNRSFKISTTLEPRGRNNTVSLKGGLFNYSIWIKITPVVKMNKSVNFEPDY